MKRKIITIFAASLLTLAIYGQKEQFISFELAGSGGIGSLNYEKTIYRKGNINLNFRSGFSLTPIDKNNGIVLIFPIMAHNVFGKTSHKLDIGIGQTISITTKGSSFLRMPLSFGYRLQPKQKNYYFRIAYTPIVSYLLGIQWEHWAGMTYGYKLKSK